MWNKQKILIYLLVGSLLTTQMLPAISMSSESIEEIEFVSSEKNAKFKILDSDYQDDLDIPFNVFKKKTRLANTFDGETEWDLLIFSQQWPVTTCYHWREEDKNHKCLLPNKKEFWTIHGIWPTKLGHIGPNFCNKSASFDINKLNRIIDQMKLFWPDIDGDEQEYNFLWKHEWLKHGTCAALLPDLNSEEKYFGQGLTWRNYFLISNILGAYNIHPDSNNTVVAIQTALFKVLGKNPSIHCLYDRKKDISLLSEIRICFNKSFDLIDCDGVKLGDAVSVDYPGGTMNTNCQISKPIHYPSLVPTLKKKAKEEQWQFPVVNVYKLLKLLWFTL